MINTQNHKYYKITDYNTINHKVINEDIFNEEKADYKIIKREDQIDYLIDWIGEAEKDKELMKEDLKYLISLDDVFILSSILTNEYIREHTEEGQAILKEIFKMK